MSARHYQNPQINLMDRLYQHQTQLINFSNSNEVNNNLGVPAGGVGVQEPILQWQLTGDAQQQMNNNYLHQTEFITDNGDNNNDINHQGSQEIHIQMNHPILTQNQMLHHQIQQSDGRINPIYHTKYEQMTHPTIHYSNITTAYQQTTNSALSNSLDDNDDLSSSSALGDVRSPTTTTTTTSTQHNSNNTNQHFSVNIPSGNHQHLHLSNSFNPLSPSSDDGSASGNSVYNSAAAVFRNHQLQQQQHLHHPPTPPPQYIQQQNQQQQQIRQYNSPSEDANLNDQRSPGSLTNDTDDGQNNLLQQDNNIQQFQQHFIVQQNPLGGGGVVIGAPPPQPHQPASQAASQVVKKAFSALGKTLQVAYEQIKRDNQQQQIRILTLQNQANGNNNASVVSSANLNSPLSPDMNGSVDDSTSNDASGNDKTSNKELLQSYKRQAENTQSKLENIKGKIQSLEQKVHEKLNETHFAHVKSKKLDTNVYDTLFYNLTENLDGVREQYFLEEHPKVEKLSDLAGTMYFLLVDKTTKKPPQVGHPFRSYSLSHYTSQDRSNPVICKVKEWQSAEDAKKVYRLYHYYSGNKKRGGRKRKRANHQDDADDEDDDLENYNSNSRSKTIQPNGYD